ncbi:MAG: type II secretion system F family protein [Tissierellia bacterium]|nr:type II secretion system F family protein [Tissierellia bacterium]
MEYKYKAFHDAQTVVEGIRSGRSEEEVRRLLTEEGLTVVYVKGVREPKKFLSPPGPRPISSGELGVLFEQMSLMLSAGVELLELISLYATESRGKVKRVMGEVYREVERGQLLSSAMAATGAFPSVALGMVRSAESAGALGPVLHSLGDYYMKRHRLEQKVLQALAYPVLLVVATVTVTGIILRYVLPVFEEVFSSSGTPLPWSTRLIMAFSRHMEAFGLYYLLVLLVALLALLVAFRSRPSFRLKLERRLYHSPLTRFFIRDRYLAFSLQAMAMEFQGGLDVLAIGESMREMTDNTYIQAQWTLLTEELKNGRELSEAMELSELFTSRILTFIRLGEQSSRLEEMLEVLIALEQGDFEEQTARINIVLEPALILIMAVIVGFIVFSIAIPMFDMVNAL